MRKQFKKYYLLLIITALFINSSLAQTDTLFWFAVPYGTYLHSIREADIVLTATDMDDLTHIIITQPYNPIMDTIFVTIDPLVNATEEIHFDNAQLIDIMNNTYIQNPVDPNPRISNCAIKIQADRDITAYYEYQRLYLNNDIFSLKGHNAMGQDFWVPFQDRWDNHPFNVDPAFAQIILAATKPNTQVTITFPKWSYDIAPGTYTFNLAQAGMTMMFVPRRNAADLNEPNRLAAFKLGGTHITSDKPIVVTVNDDSAEKNGYDFIGDQLVPVTNISGKRTIGLEYLVIKGEITNNAQGNEKVFVLTTQPNTTVQYKRKGDAGLINLGVVPIPLAGTQRSIDLLETVVPRNDFVYIVADKPIYVFHVSGFGGEMGGALVPTIDGCTGSLDVTVVRAKAGAFYLTIMTHADALNSFEISKNGGAFLPFLSAADFEYSGYGDLWIIKKSSYNRSADAVVGQPTRIRNTKNVFHLGVINEGPGTCEYGYFSDFSEARGSAIIIESGTDIVTSCYGTETQLKANGGLHYSWTPTTYLDDPNIAEPNAFLPVGTHTFNVVIDRACFADTTIPTSVEIYQNTESYFTLDENIGCAPFQVEINNLTLFADTFLIDFEDDRNYDYFANNSSSTTLYHTFQNTTSKDSVYTLRLYAYDKQKDCPDIYTKTVRVFPEINANFNANVNIGCNPLAVDFTDLSSSPTSTFDNLKWTFGDGESYLKTGMPANVTHEFSHFDVTDTVDFDVQLVATSPYFCRDTLTKTISVFSYLESEFVIDTAYGCSPLTVTITNNSSGEDHIDLDYGDGTAHYATMPFNSVVHTYTNKTNAVQNRTITLTTTNDEGCSKVWTKTVIVYPEVKADYTIDGGSYIGCNTRNATYTRLTPLGADITNSVLWTFGDGATSNLTTPTVNHIYDNTTTGDKTYTFNMKVQTQYGCWDDTSNTVTIYRADADFVVDKSEGCSVLPVNITNTSVGNDVPLATGWSWNYGDGSLLNTNQQVGTHLHNYTNTSILGVDQSFPLSLTVTRNASCFDTKVATIIVNPSIAISFVTNPLAPVTICDSVQVSFNSSLAVPVAGTSYAWNFGDATSSNLEDPSHRYRNLSSAGNVTYTAQVTATTPKGCLSVASAPIIVQPYVKSKFTVDKSAGCSPLTVNADPVHVIGNAQYIWTYGDGYNPTVQDPLPHQYLRNVTASNVPYELQLEVRNGSCSSISKRNITVYSENKANFTPQVTTGCNPQTVNFVNTSFNSTNYIWDFGDGTTSNIETPLAKTFTNLTDALKSYTVKLSATSDMGCTHDTTVVAAVNVYRNVKADFAVDIIEGCSPLTVTITNNSKGGNYRWYWNSQTGAGPADYVSANGTEVFTHQYTNTSGSDITFYLTLVAENADGCSHLLTKEIIVHSSIIANFSFVQNNACNPSDVVFTNTSTGGGSYNMNWVFGDGSTLTTTTSPVNKTFTNNTTNDKTFTVIMSAESENGCTDSHQDNITVYSKLVADFSIPVSASCPPFIDAVIENKSVGNSLNTYQWFVDGNGVADYTSTGLADFIRTYDNTNQSVRPYSIRLLATNAHGCSSEKTGAISVYEYIKAQFVMDRENGCTPLNIDFDNQSLTTAQTKYLWNFNDGATSGAFEPLSGHKFYNTSRVNDKSYTISLKLTSENYCTHDTSDQILVYHQPLSKFFIDTTSSCPPLIALMENQSSGENMFEWRFGDGTTNTIDNSLSHTYPNSLVDVVQKYNLELWVGTVYGCKDSTSLTLNVFPDVIANFTYDEQGCSPFLSRFTNTSTSPAQYFYWNFGDGSTSNQEDPVHKFTNTFNTDLVYNVRLKASSEYNCWDEVTKPVRVFLQPIAEFNINPIVQKFPQNRVFIDNRSNTGPFNYLWEKGDIDATTTTVQSPQYFDYEHWGEKDIKLTITSQTSNCSDTIMKTATILPPDVNADFEASAYDGCEPLDIYFEAHASQYNETYEYEWDLGDGSDIVYGANQTHTFNAGIYNVKLTAFSTEQNGGEDYKYKTIKVYPNPKADFDVLPKEELLNPSTLEARIKFTNLSECNDTAASGCEYEWDFGDGYKSPFRNVTHAYKVVQKYTVSLTVKTVHGCIDSIRKVNVVEIKGAGEIQFPNAFTPNGDTKNDIFLPYSMGVISYELLIYNRWGELLFKSNDETIGWDGMIKGEMGKPDVYVWKAVGTFSNGQAFELAGDVTLIR